MLGTGDARRTGQPVNVAPPVHPAVFDGRIRSTGLDALKSALVIVRKGTSLNFKKAGSYGNQGILIRNQMNGIIGVLKTRSEN